MKDQEILQFIIDHPTLEDYTKGINKDSSEYRVRVAHYSSLKSLCDKLLDNYEKALIASTNV